MYLALRPGELVTIRQIAGGYGISRNHLTKIVNQLAQAGLVEAIRGRNGGVRLGRSAERISVGSVVRAAEADLRLVECFDQGRNQCVLAPACRLSMVMREALDAFLQVLDRRTLADLVANPVEIRTLVGMRSREQPPARRKPEPGAARQSG